MEYLNDLTWREIAKICPVETELKDDLHDTPKYVKGELTAEKDGAFTKFTHPGFWGDFGLTIPDSDLGKKPRDKNITFG
ncbi:MAG: hypothetical protein AAB443_01340 [Patescibacteria group bacterium]